MSIRGALAGRRIVVTRPESQSRSLANALKKLGAEVLTIPLIRITAPADATPLRAAARNAAAYDWIIFSSANAVTALMQVLEESGLSALPSTVRICAVGSATASAIESGGGTVAMMPTKYTAEAVVAAFRSNGELEGSRILLPLAEGAADTLGKGLLELGAVVDRVEAYRTVADGEGVETLRELLRQQAVHMVTLTSGSTARSLVDGVGADLGVAEIATIGPVTSAASRRMGLHVDVEAEVHSAEGLAAAIAAHYGEGKTAT